MYEEITKDLRLNFSKSPDGLLPAVVQDAVSRKVLMVGFMNREAVEKTLESGKVTFYSRSKQRLWTKGETSGNFLLLRALRPDCDADTLLVFAEPLGGVCHTGSDTCFNEKNSGRAAFLHHLSAVIEVRKNAPAGSSYTQKLLAQGINKVAQKVGEEAVELVIEAKDDNKPLFLGEAADLLYHFLVLLSKKNISLDEVIAVLEERHREKDKPSC